MRARRRNQHEAGEHVAEYGTDLRDALIDTAYPSLQHQRNIVLDQYIGAGFDDLCQDG